MARAASRLAPSLLLALLAGCDTDLPRATEIVSMRVLGARLEVEGDEERSTPRPGERLRVTLATAYPTLEGDIEEASSMFIGCTAPDRFTGGVPVCQEIIEAAQSGADVADALPMIEGQRVRCSDIPAPRRREVPGTAVSLQCVSDEPVATFRIPEDFAAEGLLMLGVVCERGDPFIEPASPLLFGCEDADGGEVLRVQGILAVQQRTSDRNHNPSLDALSVLRENQPWEAPPDTLPAEMNCEGSTMRGDPTLHRVVPGEHRIKLRYEAAARELAEGEPENLELTVYTTFGEMERRFTLFDGSDDGGEDGLLEGEVGWDPPIDVPPGGQLVRFFITLRDQRGGFAITERALCLR